MLMFLKLHGSICFGGGGPTWAPAPYDQATREKWKEKSIPLAEMVYTELHLYWSAEQLCNFTTTTTTTSIEDVHHLRMGNSSKWTSGHTSAPVCLRLIRGMQLGWIEYSVPVSEWVSIDSRHHLLKRKIFSRMKRCKRSSRERQDAVMRHAKRHHSAAHLSLHHEWEKEREEQRRKTKMTSAYVFLVVGELSCNEFSPKEHFFCSYFLKYTFFLFHLFNCCWTLHRL